MTQPTLGVLVDVLARALDLSREVVATHAKYLRDAGHLSTGGSSGRGRGAARMNLQDVAHLLLAVLASSAAKDSVEMLEIFLALAPPPFPSDSDAATSPSWYRDARSCLVGEMQFIRGQHERGELPPFYRGKSRDYFPVRDYFPISSALTLKTALGVSAKKYPRVLQVQRVMRIAEGQSSRIEVTNFMFGTPHFAVDDGIVPWDLPALFQTRQVSFKGFRDIALSV